KVDLERLYLHSRRSSYEAELEAEGGKVGIECGVGLPGQGHRPALVLRVCKAVKIEGLRLVRTLLGAPVVSVDGIRAHGFKRGLERAAGAECGSAGKLIQGGKIDSFLFLVHSVRALAVRGQQGRIGIEAEVRLGGILVCLQGKAVTVI